MPSRLLIALKRISLLLLLPLMLLPLMLLPLTSSSLAQENDLSMFQAIGLKGLAYSAFDSQEQRLRVFIEVSHPYSNTLACQGQLSYWVAGPQHAYEQRYLRFSQLGIFPEKAFPVRLSYPVAVPLAAGEKIAPFEEQRIELLCRGWNAEIPLPAAMCEDPGINPAHRRACASLVAGASYPFMLHDQYLGACLCRRP